MPATGAADAGRPRGRPLLIVFCCLLALIVLAFALLAFVWSRPAIVADGSALARVQLPLTGGRSESVAAVGPNERPIPVVLEHGRIWPLVALAPGERVVVEVVVHRPGWIGWLAGGTTTTKISLHTPSAALAQRYITLEHSSPLLVDFTLPVRRLAYGQPEDLLHREFARPHSELLLPHSGEAGSIEVAAAARTWESLPAPTLVTWFPPGTTASAVLSPAPGSRITPTTPISLTFSQPSSSALGGNLPHISPATDGSWQATSDRTLSFRPRGYGFGLDTPVTLAVPRTVRLLDGVNGRSSSVASWTVPGGSPLRAEQILAQLDYLPLRFRPARHVARTPEAQERAAVDPPPGSFSWRYPNTPSALRALWHPGQGGIVLHGALMAFENAHELTTDGIAGPAVWRALLRAAIGEQRTHAGYTFAMVSESSQSLSVWNDGSIRITTPVNTGIASAPTELGTFPVYEHISSGTMSGTNPDGSHYEDPGVPWISYFNGGDALHGFERAQYGFPQSLGCVEMPIGTAAQVWPYTPVGTLVHIT